VLRDNKLTIQLYNFRISLTLCNSHLSGSAKQLTGCSLVGQSRSMAVTTSTLMHGAAVVLHVSPPPSPIPNAMIHPSRRRRARRSRRRRRRHDPRMRGRSIARIAARMHAVQLQPPRRAVTFCRAEFSYSNELVKIVFLPCDRKQACVRTWLSTRTAGCT
jgi:hypothetical protein